jgi:hypothetical protein
MRAVAGPPPRTEVPPSIAPLPLPNTSAQQPPSIEVTRAGASWIFRLSGVAMRTVRSARRTEEDPDTYAERHLSRH